MYAGTGKTVRVRCTQVKGLFSGREVSEEVSEWMTADQA